MCVVCAGIDNIPSGNNLSVLFNKTDIVGCRYPDEAWCITVPKIYLFQYAIALLFIAIGYPIASLSCYSIYSKILGPNKQVLPYIVPSACVLLVYAASMHRGQ